MFPKFYISLSILAFLPCSVLVCYFMAYTFYSSFVLFPITLLVTQGKRVLAPKHLTFKMLRAVNKNIYYLLQHCFFAPFAWILYDVDTMRNKNIKFHALLGRRSKGESDGRHGTLARREKTHDKFHNCITNASSERTMF